MTGVKIGDKHTFYHWGLIMTDVEIGAPQAKVKKISIPGRNGDLDLTESLAGEVKYENRSIALTFVLVDKSMLKWQTIDAAIKNYCHGKVMDIVFDSDKQNYWSGRCNVTTNKEDAMHSSFVIEIDSYPYKYDVNLTSEEWIWDSFNLKTGIVRRYKNIIVNGNKTVYVIGSSALIVPKIICTSRMFVNFESTSYELKPGNNKLSGIKLKNGSNELNFTGTGKVTIEYRGMSL